MLQRENRGKAVQVATLHGDSISALPHKTSLVSIHSSHLKFLVGVQGGVHVSWRENTSLRGRTSQSAPCPYPKGLVSLGSHNLSIK